MQYVLVYTKDDCPYCVKAKELFRNKNISNVCELKVGVDISTTDFKQIAKTNDWNPPTVPLIFYRNNPTKSWEFLGGYSDLEKYFEQ